MTVTVQQIQTGFCNWFDAELAPQLPGLKKWAARAAIAMASERLPQMMEQYSDMINLTGLRSADGGIDIDRVRDLFLAQARATGPAREVFPVIGAITFTEQDIERLYRHITGGI
jgi:hypothetical protein